MLKSSHHRFREVGRVSRRRNPTASPFNAFLSDYAALIRPTNASTSGQARGMPNAPSPLLTLRLRFLRLRFLRQASFDKLPSTSFLRQAQDRQGRQRRGKRRAPHPGPLPLTLPSPTRGEGFTGGQADKRSRSCCAVSTPSNNSLVKSCVPLNGSINGTRLMETSPTSKSTDVQLAP